MKTNAKPKRITLTQARRSYAKYIAARRCVFYHDSILVTTWESLRSAQKNGPPGSVIFRVRLEHA